MASGREQFHYLVLTTDRGWKSNWVEYDSDRPLIRGDVVQIAGLRWEVLRSWRDLDDILLAFCVYHPKEEQTRPAST